MFKVFLFILIPWINQIDLREICIEVLLTVQEEAEVFYRNFPRFSPSFQIIEIVTIIKNF